MLCFNFPLPFYHVLLLLLAMILQYFVKCVPQRYGTTLVEFLPGFDGPLPFHLETGYIGVGKSEEMQLFYNFVKSESDPILVWLTGGPGCSSMTGLFYEIGPLAFAQKTFNGSLPILVSTPYSWTKFASIIFLDQPLNTGFSITSTSSKCTDLQACNYVYEFLLKWFNDHAEFISNPFYVSGDSYSGIIIPVIVQLISDGNEAGNKPLINLKGYTLGNPVTFPEEQNYQIPFNHGMGLITDGLYESLKETCKGEYRNIRPTSELCLQYLTIFKKLVSGIYNQHILEPLCGLDTPLNQQQLFGERRSLGEDFVFLKYDDSICQESHIAKLELSFYWANDPRVQEVLHVRKEKILRPWVRCRRTMRHTTYTFTFMNSIPYHVNLSSKGYRSLIYSYTRSYSNHMTFATVKGGGHTAPEYKRKECSHMFKRWITQQPL